jgi:Predicted membrane protein
MSLIKQKNILIAPLVVLLIALIFGLATLGSTVNPVPKDLPVLFVMSDQGSTVPGQGDVNFGKTIADNLLNAAPQGQATASPFEWETVEDEAAGLDKLDREEAYALVVIPETFSGNLAGLMTGTAAEAPSVQVYINQGKNMSAANSVSQGLTQMFQAVNAKFSEQLVGQLTSQGVKIDPTRISAFANPIQVKTEIVNPVGTHSANGNAPGSLTQIAWMASLVGTLLVFFAMKKFKPRSSAERMGGLWVQVAVGAVLSLVAGFGILGIADGFFGLHVPSFLDTALFLSLNAFGFYLLMSAIMAWLGFAGMPIFMLLFFFVGPILTLPPELLPQATKTLLYSWVPLRFTVEGLRDLLYFGQGLNVQTPIVVISSVSAGALIVLFASVFKKPKKTVSEGGEPAAASQSA